MPAPATNLADRYQALQEEMVEQYERYVALGGHWALYFLLGWLHLAACVASFYLVEEAGVRLRWPFVLLWAVQTAVALGAINLFRWRTPGEASPLQRHVNRTWIVFLVLCWNVAILNVLAGEPVFVFLPVLATLSSFAFLVLASFLSRRFGLAALVMWVSGGLIARFPAYGFLIYGSAWLVVLQGLAVVFYYKRRRWLPVRAAEASPPARADLEPVS